LERYFLAPTLCIMITLLTSSAVPNTSFNSVDDELTAVCFSGAPTSGVRDAAAQLADFRGTAQGRATAGALEPLQPLLGTPQKPFAR